MLEDLDQSSPRNQIQNESGKNNQEQFENNNVEESQYTVEIPLPSKGLYYTGKNFGKESIKVKPLDWRDEDILSTPSFLEDINVVFDKIIDGAIQEKGISSSTLVDIDRKTILIWLRTQAFGSIMSIVSTCPKTGCSGKPSVEWDLSKIKIPYYSEKIEKELRETGGEYAITTPNSKLKIYLRQPNYGDIEHLKRRLKNAKNKNSNGSDRIATETMRTVIVGVQDQDDHSVIIRNKEDIFRYFDTKHLTLFDTRFIKKRIEEISLDYDTKIDLKCEKCGYIQEDVEMPINHINFFWSDI